MKRMVWAVAVVVWLTACPPLPAASISATQDDADTIRVVVPGVFETTFTSRKSFGATWFDLAHDPGKQHDLAPVLDENGLLWTKVGLPAGSKDGSWYANPPEKMELLESGPTRVRVRTSGPHMRYGRTDLQAAWKELGFVQTFTMYASGDVYIDYELVNQEPVPLHHFLLIIKSNGSWGAKGTGEGRNEVHCAGVAGADRPSHYSDSMSPFALQWSDGPTYFQDMLMVIYQGVYNGTYWNEGYEDKDIRTGLDLMSRWPQKILPAGGNHIMLLMRFDHDINSPEAALRYTEDYRAPGTLEVSKGRAVTTDAGDRDGDGFNEAEGCYVLQAGGGGATFTVPGSEVARMDPAFKVIGWTGGPPATITLAGETLIADKDFNASVSDGVLLLQVLRNVGKDAEVVAKAVPGQAVQSP